MTVGITKVYQVDAHTLGIDWSDGIQGRWRLAHLRRHCPCAACVDEWTRERRLEPDTIDENLSAIAIESVGRYALRVKFSDGHDTGIFTYDFLRELGASEERSGA